jgi:hypothetical protein
MTEKLNLVSSLSKEVKIKRKKIILGYLRGHEGDREEENRKSLK